MKQILVIVVIVVVVLAAILIPLALIGADETTDVDLYDDGSASGEGVTGGIADESSALPGSTPSPPPSADQSTKIGTYSMSIVVVFSDGTSTTLTGGQTLTTSPYYSCKIVTSFQYRGTFKADQDVVILGGNPLSRTGSYADFYVKASGSTARTLYWTQSKADIWASAGETATVVASDAIFGSSAFGTSTSAGTYVVTFTVGLKFRYSANNTASPQFAVTATQVVITIADSSSPPSGCSSGGGGGGGGGLPRKLSIMTAVDSRVWVAYWL